MKNCQRLIVPIVALVALLPAILTANPQAKNATHVVVGKVMRVYQDSEIRVHSKNPADGCDDQVFSMVELKVEIVEKGDGVNAGSVLYASFEQIKLNIHLENQVPEVLGHKKVPRKGDKVKLFLNKKGDGRFEALSPRGYLFIAMAKKHVGEKNKFKVPPGSKLPPPSSVVPE